MFSNQTACPIRSIFAMEDREVLLQEYNNLWNEKLIHKESIRKFHNYCAL